MTPAGAGEPAVRINLVAAWRESTVFTQAEQAAPALAEEGTRILHQLGGGYELGMFAS